MSGAGGSGAWCSSSTQEAGERASSKPSYACDCCQLSELEVSASVGATNGLSHGQSGRKDQPKARCKSTSKSDKDLVQPLWKTVWRLPPKLNRELPYDPATPLLGIYPKTETKKSPNKNTSSKGHRACPCPPQHPSQWPGRGNLESTGQRTGEGVMYAHRTLLS